VIKGVKRPYECPGITGPKGIQGSQGVIDRKGRRLFGRQE